MRTPILNRRLILEEAQLAPDGSGGYTQIWVVLGAVWAEVRPGVGRETAGESLTLSRVPVRILLRGAPAGAPSRPRAEQRLRDGDRVYVIEAVTEADPAGRYLACFAREEVVA